MNLKAKLLLIVVVYIFCIACEDHEEIIEEERVVYIDIGSPLRKQAYTMSIVKNEKVWKYLYEHKTDTTRNMRFTYDLASRNLKFIFFNYKVKKGNDVNVINFSSKTFHSYEELEGAGTIWFNKTYGVLKILNSHGPYVTILPQDDYKDGDKLLTYDLFY